MADEQQSSKDKTKKAKGKRKQAKKAGRTEAERTSTALVASPPESRTTDSLEEMVGTMAANQLTLGELTLSYPARDVVLVLDGVTAARVIAAFANPARRVRLQDELDTASSSMRNLWATFDLDRLLAVSWMPQLPTRATSRMTVDPPNPLASEEPLEKVAAAGGA